MHLPFYLHFITILLFVPWNNFMAHSRWFSFIMSWDLEGHISTKINVQMGGNDSDS